MPLCMVNTWRLDSSSEVLEKSRVPLVSVEAAPTGIANGLLEPSLDMAEGMGKDRLSAYG